MLMSTADEPSTDSRLAPMFRSVHLPELTLHADAVRAPAAGRLRPSSWDWPRSFIQLRELLHRQSRIESRMVMLQWGVMVLVGIGAVLPRSLGSDLSKAATFFVLAVMALHP